MLTSPGRSLAVVVAAVALAIPVGTGASVVDGPARTPAAPPVVPVSATSSQPPDSDEPDPAAPTPGSATDGLPGDRPNIVVIMADDMREDELAWMPNVQHLIGDRGVRFVNSFSPYSLCCPARASFITGQYTHNHEVWSNSKKYGFGALDDTSTLATDLSAAGYRTAFLGKYLNGYGTSPAPDGSSEDSFHYVPPGWHDWRGSINDLYDAGTPEAGGTYSYFDTTLNVNGTLRGYPGAYQTRMFGLESRDMLEQLTRSPRPFFLWVSYVAPHAGGPVEDDDPRWVQRSNGRRAQVTTPARPRDVKGMFDAQITRSLGAVPEPDLSDKPEFMRDYPTLNDAEVEALTEVTRQRAESLYVVDQEVGRTVEALEQSGELDNTLVVFTSDNGYFLGEHGMLQTKRLPYQSSLRVPTLMAGPGIPEGEVREDPVLTTDFAPTFLELAGARTERVMDGASLLAAARNGDQGWSRAVFTEAGPRNLKDQEPALEVYPEGPSPLRFSQGVRTPRYLYVEHATGDRELYDLRTDPDELESVVERPEMRRVASQLAAVLDRLRMCEGESCRVPLPAALRQP
ncbi:MAG TPA: sulfatase [Nocardioidaceae bacterium]|nr:sulfatase [Nocardioidaceae bacterium]